MKTGVWNLQGRFRTGADVWTLAALLLVALWLRPWVSWSVCLLKMPRWAFLKLGACWWLGSQGCRRPICPVRPVAAGRGFSRRHVSRALHALSLSGVCYSKKSREWNCWESLLLRLSTESQFSWLVVFLSHSWGFGGVYVEALPFYCLMKFHLNEMLVIQRPFIFVVQMESKCFTIDHWNGKIKNFHLLIFSALNLVICHFACPEEHSWHL